MRRGRTLIAPGVLLLGVSLAFALQVSTEFDGDVDFSKYATWSWGPSSPLVAASQKPIREAIEARLAARGWRLVDKSKGDAVVALLVAQDRSLDYDVYYSGWGPGWGWQGFEPGSGAATTRRTEVRTGSLVVDIFDAATRRLIWRGKAEDTLSPDEKDEKKVDQALDRLFKGFPPRPSGKPARAGE